MSTCNFCNLKEIKARKKKGERIHKISNPPEMQHLGGTSIYLVPQGEELNKEDHFVAWLMEIPDHCCC